jgi:hypothetical protein
VLGVIRANCGEAVISCGPSSQSAWRSFRLNLWESQGASLVAVPRIRLQVVQLLHLAKRYQSWNRRGRAALRSRLKLCEQPI